MWYMCVFGLAGYEVFPSESGGFNGDLRTNVAKWTADPSNADGSGWFDYGPIAVRHLVS